MFPSKANERWPYRSDERLMPGKANGGATSTSSRCRCNTAPSATSRCCPTACAPIAGIIRDGKWWRWRRRSNQDKETRRQGDKETEKLPLSCPLVSRSPCLLRLRDTTDGHDPPTVPRTA